MNYLKFLIPIAIAILLTLLASTIPEENRDIQLILGIVIKGGLLICYLRLNNAESPFINTLTAILVAMMTGEYLFNTGVITIGQIIFIGANTGFAVMYFLRQIMKDKKDKLRTMKILGVCVYCFGNILYITDVMGMVPLVIGSVFLGGVYFYDRLLMVSEQKNYRQHGV
jgi:hypothetical protein